MLVGRGSTALRQLVLHNSTHALLVGHVHGLDKGVAEHGNAERVGRFVSRNARATPSVRVDRHIGLPLARVPPRSAWA
jgi:hypothetical protein